MRFALGGLGALGALCPNWAAAHAFGARYDLPLPLWFFLMAAASAVMLSFVVVGLASRGSDPTAERATGIDAPDSTHGTPARLAALLLRVIGVAAFLLVVVASLLGSRDPFHNIAPTMVWVHWWIGLAYVVAAVGDVWRFMNPWTTLFRLAERVARRVFGRRRLSFERPIPPWLGAWPAVFVIWAFAWTELVSGVGSEPRFLGALVVAYSAWTWAGMAIFGVARWLSHGEAFSIYFGLIGRMGILRLEPCRGPSIRVVRPPFTGLLLARPQTWAQSIFVIVVLATLTFDGLKETEAWARLLDVIAGSRALRGGLLALHGLGIDLLGFVETMALLVTPLLFALLFLAFNALAAVAGGSLGAGTLARGLAMTLVPIAFAYHLAHYLSYLLLAGQLVIPLASDPLGLGWNLFGTTIHRMDMSIIDARTVWYVAVGAIVMGHIAAVYLAHRTALLLYGDAARARRSQVPILVLMIVYTVASLWILSQPIVKDA